MSLICLNTFVLKMEKWRLGKTESLAWACEGQHQQSMREEALAYPALHNPSLAGLETAWHRNSQCELRFCFGSGWAWKEHKCVCVCVCVRACVRVCMCQYSNVSTMITLGKQPMETSPKYLWAF